MRAVDPETFKMLGDVVWSDEESLTNPPPAAGKPQQQSNQSAGQPRANNYKPPQSINARNNGYKKCWKVNAMKEQWVY